MGADAEEVKVRLKNLIYYFIELEFNLKPIENHWWVWILGEILYSSFKMIILGIDGLTKHFKRAWSYQVWSSSFVSLQLDSEPLSVLYPETLNCIQFYFLGIHTSIPLGWKFFLSLWESNSHLSNWETDLTRKQFFLGFH